MCHFFAEKQRELGSLGFFSRWRSSPSVGNSKGGNCKIYFPSAPALPSSPHKCRFFSTETKGVPLHPRPPARPCSFFLCRGSLHQPKRRSANLPSFLFFGFSLKKEGLLFPWPQKTQPMFSAFFWSGFP